MAGTPVDEAVGITAVFGTSTLTMELVDFSWTGITREALEISHQGQVATPANKTGNRTYKASDLVDAGQWILTGHFDPDKFRDDPPADIVEETVTITFPKAAGDTSAATAAATCFITDVDISASLGTIQMMTLTLKITGNVTLTAAS